MTVWDAIRALNRRGLSLKYRGCWLVGRRHGPVFAVTVALPSLTELEDWFEAN